MSDTRQLCTWLRHNVGDLRTAPDMVTEAPGPAVRFRWHGIVQLGDLTYGLGVDLHPGPSLGEIWMYGHAANDVRLQPRGSTAIPHAVRARLRSILVAHLVDRERDWGRGACLGDGALLEASA